jgi:osmoprotectant transport system permease protein
VRLTVGAVVIGTLIALPLALLARRNRLLSGVRPRLSTVVYTIPSLAMFAFIFPFTGLSAATVAHRAGRLLPGDTGPELPGRSAGRPADVREAAKGMGYGSVRRFVQVDLPLALPAFMAGLRIATVSTVALTTVGVLVGHGGFGR